MRPVKRWEAEVLALNFEVGPTGVSSWPSCSLSA